jgi:hypothetical protein
MFATKKFFFVASCFLSLSFISFFSSLFTISDAGEMVFESGKIVGHRDYALYYRQRAPAGERDAIHIGRLMNHYKMLGKWKNTERTIVPYPSYFLCFFFQKVGLVLNNVVYRLWKITNFVR